MYFQVSLLYNWKIQCIHLGVALNYFSKVAHQKKIFWTGFSATDMQGRFFHVLHNTA